MLAARHRLRRSGEFTTAVKSGRRAGRPCLVLHLAEPAPVRSGASIAVDQLVDRLVDRMVDPGSGPPRVGFIVSRQVGSAVVRNRVKRRLRHLMSARVGQLPAGALSVVRANPAAAEASAATLAAELDSALGRLTRPAGARSAPARARS